MNDNFFLKGIKLTSLFPSTDNVQEDSNETAKKHLHNYSSNINKLFLSAITKFKSENDGS
ncbi:MAG: hypothetical protein RLN62_05440 [Rickettsiales bacterium]